MILLRSSSVPGFLEHLQYALEGAGLLCEMRNTMTSGLSGALPVTECVPELWLVSDDQLDRARKILEELDSTPPDNGPAWTCAKCEEVHEANFTSCWNCGSERC